jgi:adenylylsulfate kinase
MSPQQNIHPIFHRMLSRESRESLLGQRGVVVWLYGLSGSGKSTLGLALDQSLHQLGRASILLDGDNIRHGLNSDLSFSDTDRLENIRRVSHVAALTAQAGLITITTFICPLREMRDIARQIISPEDFMEVYVHASFQTCAARDPKGLYASAMAGRIQNFTGKDSAFEPPDFDANDILTIQTELNTPAECLRKLLHALKQRAFPDIGTANNLDPLPENT